MRKKARSFFKLLTYFFIFLILMFSILLVNLVNEQKTINEQMVQDTNNVENPVVVFKTNMGDIEIELFLAKSPITAGNFKELVEKGFYDKTKFHRVIKDFMIQGGDPLSKNDSLIKRWGTGGPGYAIEDEFIRNLSNVRGTLSMANSGPNSGGSQFFINVADNTFLDWDKGDSRSKHPVFGKVLSGMEIVDEISLVKTASQDRPAEHVIIEKAYLK